MQTVPDARPSPGPRPRSTLVRRGGRCCVAVLVALRLLRRRRRADEPPERRHRRAAGSTPPEPGRRPWSTVGAVTAAGRSAPSEGHDARHRRWSTPGSNAAYLGEFPRTDFSAAFAGFTAGAARRRRARQRPAEQRRHRRPDRPARPATKRRVALDVLAVDGSRVGRHRPLRPRLRRPPATSSERPGPGRLYLAKDKGEWKVFGYDVDRR